MFMSHMDGWTYRGFGAEDRQTNRAGGRRTILYVHARASCGVCKLQLLWIVISPMGGILIL